MELKGSKTEANLKAAFAGESEARNKYTYFASVAKKEGYEQIAALFLETAENEKEHAKIHFKYLNGIGDTMQNIIYTPITIFIYFLFFPSGRIISNIVTITTDKIIPFAQPLNHEIILTYLYIKPVFEILITNVTPIIIITLIAHKIASNILNVSAICEIKEITLESAIGSQIAAVK